MENNVIKSINLFSHIKNDDVFKIFDLAEKNKFNLWIVGGAIRDFFLKKKINDIDFVCDINPIELVDIMKTNELDFITVFSIYLFKFSLFNFSINNFWWGIFKSNIIMRLKI